MAKLQANLRSPAIGLAANVRSPDTAMGAGLPGRLIFGLPGEDGGYYLIEAVQLDTNTLRFTFTSSKDGMPFVDPVDIKLPEVSEEQIVKAVTEYLQENPPSGGIDFEADHTLTLKDGILSVNTVNEIIEDDLRPVTSGAVYEEFSKAVALLKTI